MSYITERLHTLNASRFYQDCDLMESDNVEHNVVLLHQDFISHKAFMANCLIRSTSCIAQRISRNTSFITFILAGMWSCVSLE